MAVLIWIVYDNSGSSSDTTITRGGFEFSDSAPGIEIFKELQRGCFGKDCIPSIDEPVFESVEKADEWLQDEDIVFVLRGENSTKGYPQAIMNLHEIVNDEFEGNPVAATFCPLCGSALAFERNIDGRVLEFGVSGFLHNSDLIMYDRQTESLWQQITGEALVGEFTGQKLEKLSFSGLQWESVKSKYPDAQILSRESGNRNYDYYPYGDYEVSQDVSFPVEGGVDTTIHPKDVVYGVEMDDVSKAYRLVDIESEGTIEDIIGRTKVTLSYNDGDVLVKDEDGYDLTPVRVFWFAWKAFHPETELY